MCAGCIRKPQIECAPAAASFCPVSARGPSSRTAQWLQHHAAVPGHDAPCFLGIIRHQQCPATLNRVLKTLLTAAGEPKAVVWSHVTPLRCGVDAWAHHDLKPGAVAAWPTNLGGYDAGHAILMPNLCKLAA